MVKLPTLSLLGSWLRSPSKFFALDIIRMCLVVCVIDLQDELVDKRCPERTEGGLKLH